MMPVQVRSTNPSEEDDMSGREENLVCKECREKIRKQVDAVPTWFGVSRAGYVVEAYCPKCWEKVKTEDRFKPVFQKVEAV